LRDAGVTVKYVILDDGWQSTALSSKGKDQDKAKDKSRAVKDKKLLKSSTSNSNTKTQDDSVEHSSDHDSTDAHKKLDSPFVLVGKHADTEEDDGELSGAQIDGNLAAQKMLEKETSVIVQFLTQVSTCTSTSSCHLYSWHCHVSHPHISITWYELSSDRSDIYPI
jgi:hypothetical protein